MAGTDLSTDHDNNIKAQLLGRFVEFMYRAGQGPQLPPPNQSQDGQVQRAAL